MKKAIFRRYHNSISAVVKLYIFTIIMASIFLWANIILMQIIYICMIQTVARSLMFVTIAFLCPIPKYRAAESFFIQEHPHTKSWQVRKFIIFLLLQYLHQSFQQLLFFHVIVTSRIFCTVSATTEAWLVIFTPCFPCTTSVV